MQYLLILMLLSILGCSSRPTGYVPEKDKLGYSDKTIGNDLRMASFQGNAKTSKENAELYAKFRAIEICHELNRTHTHFLTVKDMSYSKEISQTTTAGPSYYYGMSPYYGRYGGMGGGMYYGSAGTTTYNETYTYPMFDVYFECTHKPMDARVALTNVTQSQMQSLVKDLKGGVQVDDVLKDSPNAGKILKADIIIKANGERVDKVIEVYQASRKNMDQPFKVELIRNGVRKTVQVKFKDVSELVAESQKEIIQAACKQDVIKEKSKVCK